MDELESVVESESEDDLDDVPTQPLDMPPQQVEIDEHAHVDLQQQEHEIRGDRPGPLMRDGGKFHCNIDPSNILDGPRRRK